ncbi:hypothetical protein vseg_001032 [Gypsophila vaccaria]
MAKFNEVQKRRRAVIAEKKRTKHGDPLTKKLKKPIQPHSVSGKRQRKLLKKWRRDQKEAVDKGLISLQDVHMPDGSSQGSKRSPAKFLLKKSVKLKAKPKKSKAKNQDKSSKPDADADAEAASVDEMVE